MKKLAVWLAMFLVVGTLRAVDDYVTVGSVRYGMDTSIFDKVSIVSATFLKSVSQLEIPETHNDNPVVTIIAEVFTNSSLDEVIFPTTLESIGEGAFYGSQVKSVTFKEQAALEEGETYEFEIHKNAFAPCNRLQRVIFEGLPPTYVAENAFSAAKGYYTKAYAEQWEALIVDGKWNNLTMACWDTNLVDTGTLIYNIEADDTITIRGVSEGFSAETLELPSAIDGKTIAKIDDFAFYNCSTLKRIVFSDGLKEIGTYAFYRCTALESVTLPKSLEKIGYGAFEECTALPVVDEIRYESAEQRVVISANNMEGEITLSKGVWFIMDDAFGTRQELTAITLPEGIKNYGKNVFSNCTNLASVTLPSDMTAIPEGMFYECYALRSITFPESLQSIGDFAFYACGFNSFEIPSSVTKIGAHAFQNTGLTTLTIPSSVEELGESVLDACSGLTTVTLSEKVATLPNNFVSNCYNLTTFEIPATVKNIGKYAFQGCGLQELSIPATVESLGEGAFTGCQNLPYVLFEGGVPTTDANASVAAFDEDLLGAYFPHNRTAWEAEGVIVNGVWQNLKMFCYNENIDPSTLYTYTDNGDGTVTIKGLSETVLHAEAFEIPATVTIGGEEKTVTAIGKNAFMDAKQVTSLVISEGVTTIGVGAFYGCSSLQSITIPKSVVSIADAFGGCNALPVYDGIVYESEEKTVVIRYDTSNDGWQERNTGTALELPESVRVIASYAFSSASLTMITLPASVEVIGDYALGNWDIQMFIFKGNPPTTVGTDAFLGGTGYYSTDAWDADGVMTDGIWNNLTMLRLSENFENSDLFTYEENEDGTLTVTGLSNKVVHIGTYELPAEVDGKAVTAIANEAFAGSLRIRAFVLPDSVTTLGNGVFTNCPFLPQENGFRYEGAAKKVLVNVVAQDWDVLQIPESVRFIHSTAFSNEYYSITASTVVVPASVESIGAYAFGDATIERIIFEGLPPTVTDEAVIYENMTVGEYTYQEWVDVITEGKWYGLTMVNSISPDLVIEDLKLSTPTNDGFYFFPTEYPTLSFEIHNRGALASEATQATITLNGELFETVNLPALEVGGYTVFSKQYTFVEYGEYTLSITLDSDNIVTELDEANNSAELIFAIVDPIQTWASYDENADNTVTLTGATVVPDVMEIPATLSGKPIVAIGDEAFDNFSNLKTLIIPASVTSIGKAAFKGCTNLQNVIIADEGEALTIGMEAFNGIALKSLTLPARVT